LRISLLGDVAAKVEFGGTRNPAAFDAYLRGLKLARTATTRDECRAPIVHLPRRYGWTPIMPWHMPAALGSSGSAQFTIEKHGDKITDVRVGGHAVEVAQGEYAL
jgi:hypothetical protein